MTLPRRHSKRYTPVIMMTLRIPATLEYNSASYTLPLHPTYRLSSPFIITTFQHSPCPPTIQTPCKILYKRNYILPPSLHPCPLPFPTMNPPHRYRLRARRYFDQEAPPIINIPSDSEHDGTLTDEEAPPLPPMPSQLLLRKGKGALSTPAPKSLKPPIHSSSSLFPSPPSGSLIKELRRSPRLSYPPPPPPSPTSTYETAFSSSSFSTCSSGSTNRRKTRRARPKPITRLSLIEDPVKRARRLAVHYRYKLRRRMEEKIRAIFGSSSSEEDEFGGGIPGDVDLGGYFMGYWDLVKKFGSKVGIGDNAGFTPTYPEEGQGFCD